MKKRINLYLLACLVLFPACDSFLDIQPVGQVIPNTAKEYRALLAQAYDVVPENRGLASYRSDELTLDAAITESSDLDSYKTIWSWDDDNPTNTTVEFGWRQYYQVLYLANYVIESKDRIKDGTTDEVHQLVGESYMLRAYVHFVLVNLFGEPYTNCNPETSKSIPLKLDTDMEKVLSRNTVGEVYASVLSDLEQAEGFLNKEQWEAGFTYRFNTLSVNALRSRVYLYQGDWEKALAASKAVLQVKRNLMDLKSSTAVLPNHFQSVEAIVSLEQVMTSGYIKSGKVSSELLAYYKAGDQRKSKYYKAITASNFQVLKGGDNTFRCSFRVGEQYLNAAEAASHLSGEEETAKQYLLELMKYRYTNAAYLTREKEVQAMDAAQLTEEIAAERFRELAFEGHRWFDLRRTTRPRLVKKFKDEMYELKADDVRYTIRIPSEAIANNPNLAN